MKLEIIKTTSIIGVVEYEIHADGVYVPNTFTTGDDAEVIIMKKFDKIKDSIRQPAKEVIHSENINF